MGQPTDLLAEQCRAIELLVLDVDGVLTDGGIVYDDRGAEWKKFHVRDGLALKLWQRAGKQTAIITGRQSRVVEARARELGIATLVQGTVEKLPAFRSLLDQFGLRADQAACIGDDLPELPLVRNCGLGVAVRDGVAELRLDARYVTESCGGKGAVREVIELILRHQGTWQRIVADLRSQGLEH